MDTSALDEMYQDIILDHCKHPRNSRKLSEAEALVDEENPTCGDRILLRAEVHDGILSNVQFEAHGCAISTASASMMTEILNGKSVAEARATIGKFTSAMKGGAPLDEDWGDAQALEGVKKFPLRIKCATMAWHAVQHAIDKLA